MTIHGSDGRYLQPLAPPHLPGLQMIRFELAPYYHQNNLHRGMDPPQGNRPCKFLSQLRTAKTIVFDGISLYSSRSIWDNVPRTITGFDRCKYIVSYLYPAPEVILERRPFSGLPLHLTYQHNTGVKEIVIVFQAGRDPQRFYVNTAQRTPHPHSLVEPITYPQFTYWTWVGPLMLEVARSLTWEKNKFDGDLIFVNAGSLTWDKEQPVLGGHDKADKFCMDMQEILDERTEAASALEASEGGRIRVRCMYIREYLRSLAREGEFSPEQYRDAGVENRDAALYVIDYL